LLTPKATPSPGRARLPLFDTFRETPFPLHPVPPPTVIKTSESVSGISDKGSSGSNRGTTDPTNYPPQTRLFSQRTHSAVQGTPTEPPPAVQERSTPTEIDARTTSRIEHLKAGIRAIFRCLTSVLAMILVIELSFCYHSLIFSPEQPLRLGLGITWLGRFLLELPLRYIGFVFMHFILLRILFLLHQWLSGGEAGGGRRSTGVSLQRWRC
jgi:hypothetical protein